VRGESRALPRDCRAGGARAEGAAQRFEGKTHVHLRVEGCYDEVLVSKPLLRLVAAKKTVEMQSRKQRKRWPAETCELPTSIALLAVNLGIGCSPY